MKQSLTEKQNGYLQSGHLLEVVAYVRELAVVILYCHAIFLEAERFGEGGLLEMSQLKIMQIVLLQKAKYIYISIPFHQLKLAVAMHSTRKESVIMIYMSQNVKTLHRTVSSLRNPTMGVLLFMI